MSKYEPTAPWNEDFMTTLHVLVRSLERIAENMETLTFIINNANTNRSQETEALCERIDEIMTHIEDGAFQ